MTLNHGFSTAQAVLKFLLASVGFLLNFPAMAQEWRFAPQQAPAGLLGQAQAEVAWDPDGVGGPLPLELVVGGVFDRAGVAPASNLVAYNGTEWLPVGAGVNGPVTALAVFNGQLIVGGDFTAAGGQPASHIARFDGTNWFPLGVGLDGAPAGFTVSSGSLYVTGLFSHAGGIIVNKVARWDGSAWSALGLGINDGGGTTRAIAAFNGSIYVGGLFTVAGGVTVSNLAAWNGSAWVSPGPGMNGIVTALAVRDNGVALPTLIAGGSFSTAGGVAALNMARMTTTGVWSAFGAGLTDMVVGFAIHNTGTSTYDVAALTNAASTPAQQAWLWSGGTWNAMGSMPTSAGGLRRTAACVSYFNSRFTMGATNSNAAPTVCAWDGVDWAPLGPGIFGQVEALQPFGPDLIFAGNFKYANNTRVNYIARWNGAGWSAMDSGMNAPVRRLAVVGGTLYAAGDFSAAGSVQTNNVAKWNGATWEAAGLFAHYTGVSALTGFNGDVVASISQSGVGLMRRTSGVWAQMNGGLPVNPLPSVTSFALHNGTLYAGMPIGYGAPAFSCAAAWSESAQSWAMLSTPTGSGISALIEQGTDLLFAGHDLAAPTVPPGTTEVLARLIPPFVIPISDSLHEQAGAFPQSVSSYNGALYLTGPGFYISGVAAGPAVRSASGTEGWTSFDLQGQVNTNATATYQNELVLSGQTILTPGGGAPVVWARWFTPTPCYANCDASTSIPLLNVNDFICFLNRFAAGDPYANCDQSTTAPMLNVLDFTCFLNQFAAGCS